MKNLALSKGEVALITDRLTREYFCGVDIAEAFLFLGEKPVVYTDARYFYQAKKTLAEKNIECRLYRDDSDLISYLKENENNVLYLDYQKITAKEYFTYKDFGLEVLDISSEISKLKSLKDDEEISSIKKACEIVEKAFHKVIKTVKVGDTELDLKNALEEEMLKLGAESTSFDTIVAFNENSAVPHHETGNTSLKENSVILIDAGCKVNGYCSDLTRTVFFGKPTEKFIKTYNLVLEANLIAENKIKNGDSCVRADSYAREYLKSQGVDKFFTHSLGHGLGQEIHEYPRLSPKGEGNLTENMVFTIEPGIYYDGEFGVRIEDTVMIKNGKVERLFFDDKKLLIL